MAALDFMAATTTLHSADVIEAFLHHLQRLGAGAALVMDLGSDDGTQDLVTSRRWQGFAHLIQAPHFAADDSSNRMLAHMQAHSRIPWCLFCDPDEMVAPEIAALAPEPDVSCVALPRHNVTARRAGLLHGRDTNWDSLRLEIVKPAVRDRSQHGARHLDPPWIYGAVKSKILVRLAAVESIGNGDHSAKLKTGRSVKRPDLALRHYPMRSFHAFETKVRTTETYLAANPQFDESWGWHWRRWIRIMHEGALREEYLAQFPDERDTLNQLQDGTLRDIEPVESP